MIRYFKFEKGEDCVFVASGDENNAYQVFTTKFGAVPRKELTITWVSKADIPEGATVL